MSSGPGVINSILRSTHLALIVFVHTVGGRVLRDVADRRLSHQLAYRLEDIFFTQLMLGPDAPDEKVSIVVHSFDNLLFADQIGLLREGFRYQLPHISKERMLALVGNVQLGQKVPQTLLRHFAVLHEDVPQNQVEQCILSPVVFAYVQDGTASNGRHQNVRFVPIRLDQLVSVDLEIQQKQL